MQILETVKKNIKKCHSSSIVSTAQLPPMLILSYPTSKWLTITLLPYSQCHVILPSTCHPPYCVSSPDAGSETHVTPTYLLAKISSPFLFCTRRCSWTTTTYHGQQRRWTSAWGSCLWGIWGGSICAHLVAKISSTFLYITILYS